MASWRVSPIDDLGRINLTRYHVVNDRNGLFCLPLNGAYCALIKLLRFVVTNGELNGVHKIVRPASALFTIATVTFRGSLSSAVLW